MRQEVFVVLSSDSKVLQRTLLDPILYLCHSGSLCAFFHWFMRTRGAMRGTSTCSAQFFSSNLVHKLTLFKIVFTQDISIVSIAKIHAVLCVCVCVCVCVAN